MTAACECEGKSGLELAVCLAPPPGDFEASVELGRGRSIVLNEKGAFLRAVALDDFLPFMQTSDLPLGETQLSQMRVPLDRLLCTAIDGLLAAAEHGSVKARERAERCRGLIARLRSSLCAPGEART